MDFTAVADSIWKQIVTVTSAPVPFLAGFLLIASIIWKIIQREFANRLADSASKLELAEARVQDYERKLSGASPDEAKARMDALEARIDQLAPKIEALGPRRIGADQRKSMTPILSRYRDAHIVISADAASPDATQMSKGLTAAFGDAAWNVRNAMVMGLGSPPPTGIGVKVVDPSNLTDQEHCVTVALNAAGLAFDLQRAGAKLPIPGEPAIELILTTRLQD